MSKALYTYKKKKGLEYTEEEDIVKAVIVPRGLVNGKNLEIKLVTAVYELRTCHYCKEEGLPSIHVGSCMGNQLNPLELHMWHL